MKKITYKTILTQGDKTYQPRFVIPDDKITYWVDLSNHIEGIHGMVGKNVWSVRYAKPIIFGEHENSYLNECFKIVAQSELKLEGIPVISLDDYIENKWKDFLSKYPLTEKMFKGKLGVEKFKDTSDTYDSLAFHVAKFTENQYTLKDIEKAIDLARRKKHHHVLGIIDEYSKSQIIEQINSISIINVDEQFNIISYE